jgi:hypothetical protein
MITKASFVITSSSLVVYFIFILRLLRRLRKQLHPKVGYEINTQQIIVPQKNVISINKVAKASDQKTLN